jgi:RNA polymerase primary sigma factor
MNDNLVAKPPPLSESLVGEYGFTPEALPVLQQARSISIGQVRALMVPEVLADFSGLLGAMDKAIGFLGSRGISVNLSDGAQKLLTPRPKVNGQGVKGKHIHSVKSERGRKPQPIEVYIATSDEDEAPRDDRDLDPVGRYLKSIGSIPRITPEEEIELAGRIKKGDESAREKMITANLRLVVRIARIYCDLGLSLLDLISEGNIGLMKSVERFEPGRGAKLSTYAAFWIKQSIKRALAYQGRTIRVPVHMVDKMVHMHRTTSRLYQEFEREPTVEEVAEKLGISPERVKNMQAAFTRPMRLDSPFNDENDGTLADIIPDTRASDPAQKSEDQSEFDQIPGFIDKLTERERTILNMRFGLDDGGDGMTFKEIGKRFGISHERIRQIHIVALQKLRADMERKRYKKMPKKRKAVSTVS